MLVWWMTLASFASEPEIAIRSSGWVEGHVDIAASVDDAWALVSDPAAVGSLDTARDTTVVPGDACDEVTLAIRHPLASPTFVTRWCREAATTVRQTLVSGDMAHFDAEWRVEAHGEGVRLHHRWKGSPSAPIPQFVVNRLAARGARDLMGAIRDRLERRPPD